MRRNWQKLKNKILIQNEQQENEEKRDNDHEIVSQKLTLLKYTGFRQESSR